MLNRYARYITIGLFSTSYFSLYADNSVTSSPLFEKQTSSSRGFHRPPPNKGMYHNPEADRQFVQNEMKQLPTLQKHLARISEVQKSRKSLQDERIAISSNSSLDEKQMLNRFHSLLKRDDTLAEQQKNLIAEMMKDYDKIQVEIANRISFYNNQKNKDRSNDKDNSQIERAVGFLGFLDKRLQFIKEKPQRWTMALRLTKSFDSFDEDDTELLSRRKALANEKEELERRLREIERESGWIEMRLKFKKPPPPPPPDM